MSINDYLSFILAPRFDVLWHGFGLGDEELSQLQTLIATDPIANPVIPETNGTRKIRFARKGGGKSGGFRVCYAYFPTTGMILLQTLYAKNRKTDLSSGEKKMLASLVEKYQRFLGENQ